MKWFTAGLDLAGLKKAYKQLVKSHHPDVGGKTTDMQEINNEYDIYFTSVSYKTPSYESAYSNVYEEAKKSREYIIFVVFNKYSKIYYPITVIDTYDMQEAFEHYMYTTNFNQPGFYLLSSQSAAIVKPETLTEDELLSILSDQSHGMFGDLDNAHIIPFKTPFGAVYSIDDYGQCVAKVNGALYQFYFTGHGLPKSFTSAGNRISYFDTMMNKYQNCSFTEFCNTHDVNYINSYHSIMKMHQVDKRGGNLYFADALVQHLVKVGVVKIYQSDIDFRCRYGSFTNKLIDYLPNLTIEDVEEVQDFLDELHDNLEKTVKSKIKKGAIRVVI